MRAATGCVLILAGVLLAARSGLLLAGRGRPRRGPRPALVIAGPYVRVRNPLYAGCLLALAGAALACASPVLGAVAAVVGLVLHTWVVTVEEPRLAARFGAAYAAYLVRVPRWLPRVRPTTDRDHSEAEDRTRTGAYGSRADVRRGAGAGDD